MRIHGCRNVGSAASWRYALSFSFSRTNFPFSYPRLTVFLCTLSYVRLSIFLSYARLSFILSFFLSHAYLSFFLSFFLSYVRLSILLSVFLTNAHLRAYFLFSSPERTFLSLLLHVLSFFFSRACLPFVLPYVPLFLLPYVLSFSSAVRTCLSFSRALFPFLLSW